MMKLYHWQVYPQETTFGGVAMLLTSLERSALIRTDFPVLTNHRNIMRITEHEF